jgi:hypothetical protein
MNAMVVQGQVELLQQASKDNLRFQLSECRTYTIARPAPKRQPGIWSDFSARQMAIGVKTVWIEPIFLVPLGQVNRIDHPLTRRDVITLIIQIDRR